MTTNIQIFSSMAVTFWAWICTQQLE